MTRAIRQPIQPAMMLAAIAFMIWLALPRGTAAEGLFLAPPAAGETQSFTLNGVAFRYPSKLQIDQRAGADREIVSLRHPQYGYSLFVAVPSPPLDQPAVLATIKTLAGARLAPGDSQAFRWKSSPLSAKVSAAEIGHGRFQGFNGHARLEVQYHHLRANQKDVFVGYFFSFSPSPDDAKLFEQGLGGDSFPAMEDCAQVISSITGESAEELTPRGGVPGGIPPPALPSASSARPVSEADLGTLARETMKSSTSLRGVTVIWWMAEEYWQIALAKFAAERRLTDAQTAQVEAMFKPLRSYTLISAVEAKGEPGNFAYTPEAALRSSMVLSDNEGQTYRPLPEEAIAPEARKVLQLLQPVFAKVFAEFGPFGENFKLFIFPANTPSGRRIADAKAEGGFSVQLGKQSFRWRTPVGALLPPKHCPVDGEEVNGAWKFCPWHGVKLPDDK